MVFAGLMRRLERTAALRIAAGHHLSGRGPGRLEPSVAIYVDGRGWWFDEQECAAGSGGGDLDWARGGRRTIDDELWRTAAQDRCR